MAAARFCGQSTVDTCTRSARQRSLLCGMPALGTGDGYIAEGTGGLANVKPEARLDEFTKAGSLKQPGVDWGDVNFQSTVVCGGGIGGSGALRSTWSTRRANRYGIRRWWFHGLGDCAVTLEFLCADVSARGAASPVGPEPSAGLTATIYANGLPPARFLARREALEVFPTRRDSQRQQLRVPVRQFVDPHLHIASRRFDLIRFHHYACHCRRCREAVGFSRFRHGFPLGCGDTKGRLDSVAKEP